MSRANHQVEILEMGVDGTFEIPSPSRAMIEDDSDDETTTPTSFKEVKDTDGKLAYIQSSNHTFKNLIADIAPGGFKVMESKSSNAIIVVIILGEKEKAEKLNVFAKSIEVETSNKRIVTVDLIVDVDIKTAVASSYDSILCVNIKKISDSHS